MRKRRPSYQSENLARFVERLLGGVEILRAVVVRHFRLGVQLDRHRLAALQLVQVALLTQHALNTTPPTREAPLQPAIRDATNLVELLEVRLGLVLASKHALKPSVVARVDRRPQASGARLRRCLQLVLGAGRDARQLRSQLCKAPDLSLTFLPID